MNPRAPTSGSDDVLRIGVLGAARIAPWALIRPAREVAGATVVSVAARDRARADRFAAKHRIPTVHDSYEALLADPGIDAIYNPLPNGLHGEWSMRALTAGKHVLCEKPLTANADEAQAVATAAERHGRVLMEAFHWRYHPLAARMREIISDGTIGRLLRLEASMCVPLPFPGDIRFRLDLAGGALMDAGCYAVNMVRYLSGLEPSVVRAEAKLMREGVDRAMSAELELPGGATAAIRCSLLSSRLLDISVRAIGDQGTMRVLNPLAPHIYHRLVVECGGERSVEKVAGRATYTHQLEHFVAAVRGESQVDPQDSVANMRVIDEIYRAAGLEPRKRSTM